MDTDIADELRVLRARAYGPSADIDDDPAALRRLHELESRQSPPEDSPAEEAAVTPVGEASSIRSESETPSGVPLLAQVNGKPKDTPEPAVAEPEAEPVAEKPARVPRVPLLMKVLWGLSVVAAAAAAAAVTFAATYLAPVSVSSGAEQIATLEPVDSIVPTGWMGAGASSLTFEFLGLTLFEAANGMGFAGPGGDCFTVVTTEEIPEEEVGSNGWSYGGNVMYSGCRVGSFPATVQIPVNSNVPQEIRDRFGNGSALQFVLDGERIGVFLDQG